MKNGVRNLSNVPGAGAARSQFGGKGRRAKVRKVTRVSGASNGVRNQKG